MLAPSTFVWQGHTTLQSSLICLFISITDGLTALELLWPWGDGKVMRHRVDVDHYWFNREAAHSSLMLPFTFPSNILLSRSACHWLGQDKWGVRYVTEPIWQRDSRRRERAEIKSRLGGKLREDWCRGDRSEKGPREHKWRKKGTGGVVGGTRARTLS